MTTKIGKIGEFFGGAGGTKEETIEKEQEEQNEVCETEPNTFDNKMHPAKIVEKNWVDPYKLAKLIVQQEKRLQEQHINSIFEEVTQNKLDSAFAVIRCNSSVGYRSPKGGATASRCSVPRLASQQQMFNTMQGPHSSNLNMHDLNSTQEGGKERQSIHNMELEPHHNFEEGNSLGTNSYGDQSDRSAHFVQHFFKTQQKVDGDRKPNIINEKVLMKKKALEETRKLEQTLKNEQSNPT